MEALLDFDNVESEDESEDEFGNKDGKAAWEQMMHAAPQIGWRCDD